MTNELISQDGIYLATDQDDGNFVIYRRSDMKPLWDRWSYESNHGESPPYVPAPSPNAPIDGIGIPSSLPSHPTMIADSVNPIGMSYWNNINYHAGRDNLRIALSIDDELFVLTVDKASLEVIGDKQLGIHHTGEGIYFSKTRFDILYVPLDDKLIAVNVFDGSKTTVWKMQSGSKIWQTHANHDGTIFSATIRDSNYNNIAWGVLVNGHERRYSMQGVPDECQIDKSGNWLIIKEDNYNRIIHIPTGGEKFISDKEGAVGHSDVGHGYVVGEDNFIGGAVRWDLNTLQKRVIYGPDVWNLGYVSVQNNRCLISLPDSRLILADIGVAKFVCNAPTDSQEYEDRVKANLCPLGEYAVWTARQNGTINAYVVRIP